MSLQTLPTLAKPSHTGESELNDKYSTSIAFRTIDQSSHNTNNTLDQKLSEKLAEMLDNELKENSSREGQSTKHFRT